MGEVPLQELLGRNVVGSGGRAPLGPISPDSGRDCVKSPRSSYTGLYPQYLLIADVTV